MNQDQFSEGATPFPEFCVITCRGHDKLLPYREQFPDGVRLCHRWERHYLPPRMLARDPTPPPPFAGRPDSRSSQLECTTGRFAFFRELACGWARLRREIPRQARNDKQGGQRSADRSAPYNRVNYPRVKRGSTGGWPPHIKCGAILCERNGFAGGFLDELGMTWRAVNGLRTSPPPTSTGCSLRGDKPRAYSCIADQFINPGCATAWGYSRIGVPSGGKAAGSSGMVRCITTRGQAAMPVPCSAFTLSATPSGQSDSAISMKPMRS